MSNQMTFNNQNQLVKLFEECLEKKEEKLNNNKRSLNKNQPKTTTATRNANNHMFSSEEILENMTQETNNLI